MNAFYIVFAAAVTSVQTVAVQLFVRQTVSARRKSDEKKYPNQQQKKMARQNAKVSLSSPYLYLLFKLLFNQNIKSKIDEVITHKHNTKKIN